LNKRGFTLIELLVAAALFLLAVYAFSCLLKMGMATVDTASRLNHAVYAIQAKKEEIFSLPFNQLPSLHATTFANGAGKISVMSVLSDLVNIELELEWDPKRIPLKLYTLRSKYQ
jgi:prepilin-type N-terminal cleavage/methylation domain-containing protein